MVVLFLDFEEFCGQNLVVCQIRTQPLKGSQALEGLGCHLSENYVLEVQKGARGECNEEFAVVSVLLTDATEESGSVVRKFK